MRLLLCHWSNTNLVLILRTEAGSVFTARMQSYGSHLTASLDSRKVLLTPAQEGTEPTVIRLGCKDDTGNFFFFNLRDLG